MGWPAVASILLATSAGPASAQLVDLRIVADSSSDDRTTPSADLLRDAREEAEEAVRRTLELLGSHASTDSRVTIRAYGSSAAKADATGDDRPMHVDETTGVVHAVLTDEVRGDRLGGHARVLAARALGRSAHPVLEIGLATFSSTGWRGRGYEYWGTHLHRAGLIPPLARILSDSWIRETSPLVVEPVAGLLVAHLVGRWAREGFLERYDAWAPTEAELEAMETGWQAFLDAVAREHAEDLRTGRARLRSAALAVPGSLRGVNYAHEGYRRYEGYLSDRSETSLERLAELGANAVAILPYSFMSVPNDPSDLRVPTRVGSETDAAVSRAIRSARELGMTVLLKPHIWLRGSWPGEIRMETSSDWDRFFESYERWILHYALLAEIHEVPLLSVGVELSSATLGLEDRWRALVERVRRVYSGALVYAANWGEEFENLGFWDAFDYLGVDAYYPLSDDPAASDQELRRGARAMLDRIERVHRRFDKPLLFTEIGFASTRGAWVRPWEGHLGEVPDPEHQLRGYRAVISEMNGRDWIAGAFWWEWPSDLRRASSDPRGYMPTGKPAESVLSDWFRRGPAAATERTR